LSNASSSCLPNPRLEWRPSRWLCVALLALGVLGAVAIGMSAMPGALQLPAAAVALVAGLRAARREGARPPLALRFAADGSLRAGPDAKAQAFGRVRLRIRGRCAWLHARGDAGTRLRLAWWPDTMVGADARVLRLAAAGAFAPADRARPPSFATMPG
jgi:toxin CptA